MSAIYLHSSASDFAATQPLTEAVYLGRALERTPRLKLYGCGCSPRGLVRIRRTTWMRMIPGFRYYSCLFCGARIFRLRLRHRLGYGAIYIPPSPLPVARERLLITWPAIWPALRSRQQT